MSLSEHDSIQLEQLLQEKMVLMNDSTEVRHKLSQKPAGLRRRWRKLKLLRLMRIEESIAKIRKKLTSS